MPNPFRNDEFLAYASSLSYALFGTANAQRLVLCIEADGAINVEVALNGSCSSRRASTRGQLQLPTDLLALAP